MYHAKIVLLKLHLCNENVTLGMKETIIRLIEVCVYYHTIVAQ